VKKNVCAPIIDYLVLTVQTVIDYNWPTIAAQSPASDKKNDRVILQLKWIHQSQDT